MPLTVKLSNNYHRFVDIAGENESALVSS